MPSPSSQPGRSPNGLPLAGANAAETIESFDYSAPTSAKPLVPPEAAPSPVLTREDELGRAAAHLASVFPGFLSIAYPVPSTPHRGLAVADASDGASAERDPSDAASDELSIPAEATDLWRKGWQAGLEEGREEGMLAARDAFAAARREDADSALETARQQVFHAIQEFGSERERYFHELEQEAVRLALAIAARILRREAQMDPLLLTGAVRVALGQLGESTAVRLIVPEADRPLWEESLRLTPGLRLRPEVIGDARMELGECRLQTDFGGADLSLHEQLREIERGFFDRLPQRAVTESSASAARQPARRVEEAATNADFIPGPAATEAAEPSPAIADPASPDPASAHPAIPEPASLDLAGAPR